MAADEPRGHDPQGSTVAWRSFYDEARHRLAAAGFDTAAIDARRIVEQASVHEGADFHDGLAEPATKRGVVAFDGMLERRLAGEPLQYVLGRWGFRTLDLMVDARVLIPRPETEVVAGVALEELARVAASDRRPVAVDLGTGSGAIGLSLAVEGPDASVIVTDVDGDALEVARANLVGIGSAATRVTVLQGSWFAALPSELRGGVDVVVSNPPYVSATDDVPSEVIDWEPVGALIAADDGRSDLAELIGGAGEWLRGGGALVLELAPRQAGWAVAAAAASGFTGIEVIRDLSGRDRVVRGRWPS